MFHCILSSLSLFLLQLSSYIYVFPFTILGINRGHNLKFEALIDVRPLTVLEGGQEATGGVNGQSFGDDLCKNISLAYFWLRWVFAAAWAFFIFREWGLLSSCGARTTAVASLVAERRL